MDSDETPYLLPDGVRVWVIKTPTADEPEGVVVPFELWRALDTRAFDDEGFDTTYAIARARLADPRPSIPLEQVAAEFGWDLDEPIDDSDLPK